MRRKEAMLKATNISAREATRVQAAPVDLEHGRFEPDHVVRLFAIAVGGLGSSAFGGLLLSWGAGVSNYRSGFVSALGVWLAVFGGLMFLLGLALAGAVIFLGSLGWWRHIGRVDDWHYAQLNAYESAGGQESEREVHVGSLSVREPSHLALVIIHVLDRASRDAAPSWTSTALRGDLWCGNVKLGQLSKPQAEEFAKALAQLGLVTGRVKGSAGQLATRDMGSALALLGAGYGKVRPGALESNTGGDENA